MRAPAKYLFDLDFGRNADHKPAAPPITLAEHMARVADAETVAYRKGFFAAEAQAKADADRRVATALEAIAASLADAAHALDSVEARLESEAVEVAVAVARKLAPSLIAREPFGEIAALAGECFRQLVSTPHLVVRVSDTLYQDARKNLDEIARSCGFEGRLVVLAEPDIAPGDCRIEWADGGITRSVAAAEAAIGEAVTRYVGARRSLASAHETLRRFEHE
jgi:flagellar assembly protein FliH